MRWFIILSQSCEKSKVSFFTYSRMRIVVLFPTQSKFPLKLIFCIDFWSASSILCLIKKLLLSQHSDRPGKPGKLRELPNTSRKSGKTWKSQGILFEANYFNFAQILIGVNLVFCVILNYGRTYILLNYGRIYYSEHCFLSVLLAVHVYLLCSKCCK